MEWWQPLLILLGSFIILLFAGMPVALTFLAINIVAAVILWGGLPGLQQLVKGLFSSVNTFSLVPVPLFILMGDIMFYSGMATHMINAIDGWLGKVPGRLGLLAVAGGTLFATMSGSAMSGVAVLGSTLEPEMEKRGYRKDISIGPILASGCLAAMIPPSALGVILASVALISIGKLLIAIIIPGLVMASLYAIYIVARCSLQPKIAPIYETESLSLSDKVMSTVKYILPQGIIIFLVIGLMFLGVATPSEAAALGAAGCFAVVGSFRMLNWQVFKDIMTASIRTTGMVFLIFVSAITFSQVLAFSGATAGLTQIALAVPLTPIALIVVMQIIVLIMGMFMESTCIMMITIPIYMPVIKVLGLDPIWFAVMMLINLEIAPISPPFGLCLFVMKGVTGPQVTMKDIYAAAWPFVALQCTAIGLVMAFPVLAQWLPSLAMK